MKRFRAWHRGAGEMLEGRQQSYQGNVFAWLEEGQPIDIMEYTGLNDICEDDIVKITGEGYYSNDSFSVDEEAWEFIGRVEMNSFMWMVTQKDGTWFPFVDLITEDNIEIETIGNMFESPELLP